MYNISKKRALFEQWLRLNHVYDDFCRNLNDTEFYHNLTTFEDYMESEVATSNLITCAFSWDDKDIKWVTYSKKWRAFSCEIG